jgi:hypothetical protein
MHDLSLSLSFLFLSILLTFSTLPHPSLPVTIRTEVRTIPSSFLSFNSLNTERPPPSEDQLPGLPNAQVGISDLPPHQYPWNEPAQNAQLASHARYLPPHPMQLVLTIPRRNDQSFFYSHDLPGPGLANSPPLQVQDNFPTEAQRSHEISTIPSGCWAWQPYTAPSQSHHLPPITSPDFSPSLPNA